MGTGYRNRQVDGFVDVTDCIGTNALGRLAAARLLGDQDNVFEQTYRALRWIDMRRRVAPVDVEGPYLVRSSTPLAFWTIEQHLKSLSADQLTEFLRNARF